MSRARRASRSGSFTLPLAPEAAFHLFTADGERLWVEGWDPMVPGDPPLPLPRDAEQEEGLVFLTGAGDDCTIWTVLHSCRESGRLRYSRVTPASRAGIVDVALTAQGEGCLVSVAYDLTALTPAEDLAAYQPAAFAAMLRDWSSAIHAAIAA